MSDEHGHTIDDPRLDKRGAELDRQRFQMLRDIALELSGPTPFSATFDSVMRLCRALDAKGLDEESAAALVAGDPAVLPRVVALANSTFYNGSGGEIRDVQRAVEKIGIVAVRSVALAIAMRQLLLNAVAFQEQGDRLWGHSLRSASAAYVIAKRLTDMDPAQAMLVGMIHDIGACYMIYREAQYEELVLRPETARYLAIRWHESIGHSLAIALGLTTDVADALLDHDQPRAIPLPPQNLADVVYLANLLAGGRFEWLEAPNGLLDRETDKLESLAQSLNEEIALHEASLKAAMQ